jgi:hypothetical protein
MADMPIKHKPFSAQEILLRSEHRPFFEGPEEMAEWPGDFDPLLERGPHEARNALFCTSRFLNEADERIGLQTEADGYYIFKLLKLGEVRIQPHLWSVTSKGMGIATPYLFEIDGQLNKCYFGDLNGDGMDDIAYQTKITDGGIAVYRNYVLLRSSWRKILPDGAVLPETYENLLEKSLQYYDFTIRAETFDKVATPEVVKAITRFIGSVAALDLPKEKENLVVTDAASILHHLGLRAGRRRSQGSSDEQLTDEVLQVIHTLRVIFERVARHENAEELTEFIHEIVEIATLGNENDDNAYIKDIEIVGPLLKLTEHIEDASQLKRSLAMLELALSRAHLSRRDHISAVHLIYELAKNLSNVEFSLIYGEMRKRLNDVYTMEGSRIIGGLEDIVFNDPPGAYFAKAYEWLADKDPEDINRELLTKYGFAFNAVFSPPYEDILYADKHLGPEKAKLLYEKFNIVHFKRYSPSILDHLVEMAKDPGHKRDKPLVLALVAKSDPRGMFYWGKTFDYNEDTRVIVVEVGSTEEFLYYNRWVKENYGTPNAVFMGVVKNEG